jgi:hypothetical protein
MITTTARNLVSKDKNAKNCMKKLFIAFLSLILLAISCDSDQKIEPSFEPGTYVGKFSRSSPTADWMVANVTIIFDQDTFKGVSDTHNYPAICRGKYQVIGNKITLENECPFTADFDWTFILGGDFLRETHGDEMWLTKKYGDHVFDQYRLKKQ